MLDQQNHAKDTRSQPEEHIEHQQIIAYLELIPAAIQLHHMLWELHQGCQNSGQLL
jgi:hypothetical protein